MSLSGGATSTASNNWANVWHKILGAIWDNQGVEDEPLHHMYLDQITTDKKYFDDVEFVGTDLWHRTGEGEDLDLGTYGQGIVTRYEPIKFSKRLVIPEELEEDSQYDIVYDATRVLRQAETLTEDYDAVGLLNDAASTANGRVGGDGKAMCDASHPIRGGATVSNILPYALAPSNTAMGVMLVMIEKMPSPEGYVTRSLKATKVVGPTEYKWRMREIWKSEKKDDTANNAVNALKGELSEDYVGVPFMASKTNWFVKTNAKRGAQFVMRRPPRLRNTSSNVNETKVATGSARWVVGWSNFRGYVMSQI